MVSKAKLNLAVLFSFISLSNCVVLSIVRGQLTINSGGGNDHISTNNTKGDITVNSQAGANNLTIEYGNGNMHIDLQGSGEDIVSLFEIAGNLDLKTWDDNDLITINKVFGSSLLIDLGDGDDNVNIQGTVLGGTVLGGSGEGKKFTIT